MSADHRKPVVAFIVLAFIAAALVGIQRADAQAGRFLALVTHDKAVVHGTVSLGADTVPGSAVDRFASLVRDEGDTSFVSAESRVSGGPRADGPDPSRERAIRDRRPARGAGFATKGGRDSLRSARNGGPKALIDAPKNSRTESRANGLVSESGRPSGRRSSEGPGFPRGHRSSVRVPHDADRTAPSVDGRNH